MQTLHFSRPSLSGVTLHAQVRGDEAAPCVVLLHGGGANLHWWDEIAPRLAESFRVVCLDFRGHGDSDHPEERPIGAFARDLEALLEELGQTSVALVGHSMGGHVALDHAARNPAIWSVVAVEISFGSAVRERRRTRLALQLRREYRTFEEAVARYRLLPHSPGVSEARRVELAEQSIRALPEGGFAYKFDPAWFGLPAAPHASLGDVRCPALVIRGGDSTLLTREGAEAVVAKFPKGSLLEIAEAGHNVHLEQPEVVANALIDHLSQSVGL